VTKQTEKITAEGGVGNLAGGHSTLGASMRRLYDLHAYLPHGRNTREARRRDGLDSELDELVALRSNLHSAASVGDKRRGGGDGAYGMNHMA
jgi:hypothetical protein